METTNETNPPAWPALTATPCMDTAAYKQWHSRLVSDLASAVEKEIKRNRSVSGWSQHRGGAPTRRGSRLRAWSGRAFRRAWRCFLPVTVDAMTTRTAATRIATIQRTQSIPRCRCRRTRCR